MPIYLDNAATTRIDPLVTEVMTDVMGRIYGNPSSTHSLGREARAEIEKARRKVASLIGASPAEVFFTSGGTEADNMAIRCAVRDLGVRHIITSPIEHHAVLHTAEAEQEAGRARISMVRLTDLGHVDLGHLEELLRQEGPALVSLMHGNNEIGNLLDLHRVSMLCRQHGAYFHSDTVQTMAHYPMDLKALDMDFITCSAHKFHGPKGVGFLYIGPKVRIGPLLQGGAQERNMRGGTENIYGIVGLAKAMEIANAGMEEHRTHIAALRALMMARLRETVPDVRFNGDAEGGSLYTVLNVSFPASSISEMLLFNLDIMGICVSGGSACSSGSDVGSHVLSALHADPSRPSVRFSFGRYNTLDEIEEVIGRMEELLRVHRVA
ncbi:MAG: cysteine desulfurase [Flavobacteriales bacterium]|nr:cysteine desulfurase [Flavobacteriales bacterium]